jgi:hypothetical protein
VPSDDVSHLTAKVGVTHVAHPFGLEDGIGEAVHVAGRRRIEPANLLGRQAEAQLDAQLKEEPRPATALSTE